MAKSFEWEIIPMKEMERFHVWTETDSVLSAAQAFEEQYGNHIEVYAIRKAAILQKFEEAI